MSVENHIEVKIFKFQKFRSKLEIIIGGLRGDYNIKIIMIYLKWRVYLVGVLGNLPQFCDSKFIKSIQLPNNVANLNENVNIEQDES